MAAGAEHLAVVECQACLVDKKVDECVVVKTERAAVEPYEERGLGTQRTDGGQMLATVVDYIVDIVLHL